MRTLLGPSRPISAFAFFALCAASTQSIASDCETHFKEMRTEDGGRLYTTDVRYPSVDSRKVLDQFSSLAKQRGYIVISPADVSGDIATLGIAKPPAPGPIMITANPAASVVSVTSMVPAGAHADPVHERTVVCDLLSGFDAATHGRPVAAARNTSGEDENDASRTTLPTAIPSVNLVSPKSRFDAAAARAALKPGNAAIRGQACGGAANGALAYASSVALFPATPYLEELLRLEKTSRPGRDTLVPEPDALTIRMVAKADSEGRFQFSRMKPGRYYLTTTIGGVFGATRDVQVGRVEDAFGGANVYAKQDYTFDAESSIGKFVSVGQDGEIVTVLMQPPISANPFRKGMRGSILGCHRLP